MDCYRNQGWNGSSKPVKTTDPAGKEMAYFEAEMRKRPLASGYLLFGGFTETGQWAEADFSHRVQAVFARHGRDRPHNDLPGPGAPFVLRALEPGGEAANAAPVYRSPAVAGPTSARTVEAKAMRFLRRFIRSVKWRLEWLGDWWHRMTPGGRSAAPGVVSGRKLKQWYAGRDLRRLWMSLPAILAGVLWLGFAVLLFVLDAGENRNPIHRGRHASPCLPPL